MFLALNDWPWRKYGKLAKKTHSQDSRIFSQNTQPMGNFSRYGMKTAVLRVPKKPTKNDTTRSRKNEKITTTKHFLAEFRATIRIPSNIKLFGLNNWWFKIHTLDIFVQFSNNSEWNNKKSTTHNIEKLYTICSFVKINKNQWMGH